MTTITGTSGSDPNLQGTSFADTIFGRGGNDTLIGLGGSDTLDGGGGADELFGSAGFDYARYANSSTGVTVSLLEASGANGEAAGDHLYSIEGVIGSAHGDYIEGDDLANVVRGGGGADGLYGLGGNDSLIGGTGDDYLEGGAGDDLINGGDGYDVVGYVSLAAGVVVNLYEGFAQGGDLPGTDRLIGIEGVLGTRGDDQLTGNAAANGFRAGFGQDTMFGGGGADQFRYTSTDDSPSEAPDLLLAFSHAQGDIINLAAIDANEQADGVQVFRFVGTHAFTGAGQVRFYQQDGDTIVEANTTDADPGAEMRIVVDPLVKFQASDFYL